MDKGKPRKGVTRAQVFAHTPLMYQSVSDVPWSEVEKAAGKKFTPEERAEIHKCTDAYSGAGLFLDENPKWECLKADFDELTAHLNGVCDMAERYGLLGSRVSLAHVGEAAGGVGRITTPEMYLDTEGEKAREALYFIAGLHGCDLRSGLPKLAAIAERLRSELSGLSLDQYSGGDYGTTNRLAHTVALEEFVACVLKDAVAKRARREPRYRDPKSFEYERWGLCIGPTTGKFRAFLNALLKSGFKKDSIKDAFDAVRRQQARYGE